ncbi:MAG: SpoIIE family protein phosphatase [Actinobacteria bacterium]|nr:SpoIIE family protein phosphatase [Actinomycetota bacterium]
MGAMVAVSASGAATPAPAGSQPMDGDPRLALALAQAEASPDGLLVVSPDGRMVFWNERFLEIWRFSAELLSTGDDDAALRCAMQRVADPEGFLRRVKGAYAAPDGPVQDEIELLDGRILDRYGAPLRSPEGDYLGWAWYFRDVTFHRRAERDLRELAATLQASLLPPRPPEIPGMEVATHYLPADRQLAVGGDFFDVFRLSPNEWGLAIGDVCGKGAQAAALSTLARYTLRAAAVHSRLPSAVLSELNAVITAEAEHDGRFCSVVFSKLELDTCGAWVTLACGGHPRPIVVRRAGWIDMRGHEGMLIGMFEDVELTDDRVGLGPGDSIVFCTDGITEARNPSGEMFGEDGLPTVLLENAAASAPVMTERIVQAALAFSGGRRQDDVAVLVVRVPTDAAEDPARRLAAAVGSAEPSEGLSPSIGDDYVGLRNQRPTPPRQARIRLPAELTSARQARRFVASVLRSWRIAEVVDDDLEVLTSELATNAVRHAGGPFSVLVRYNGEVVRVEVGDGSRVLPLPRTPDSAASSGRGLLLVSSLASAWGVVPTVHGKRVWFEVPVPAPE